MNALEIEFRRVDRHGRIESHLGADAILCGRIELGPERARNDQKIAIGLEARCYRPFDFLGIADIDVLVDDDNLLNVIVGAEGTHDDVFRLAVGRLVDLDGKMVAAGAAARETYVEYVREAAP